MKNDDSLDQMAEDLANELAPGVPPTPVWDETVHGRFVLTFRDFYGSECSLREGWLAFRDTVWLGIDTPNARCFPEGAHPPMLLTREHVRALLPALQEFAATGTLSPGVSVARLGSGSFVSGKCTAGNDGFEARLPNTL